MKREDIMNRDQTMSKEQDLNKEQKLKQEQELNQGETANKEQNINTEMTEFQGMNAQGIWEIAYGKTLDCKKNIIEYIEKTKVLSKETLNANQVMEIYSFIEKSIDDMKAVIKPNTVLQLKKELDAKLGKFAPKKTHVPENHFLKFFTEAYPKNKRYKEYTWVLMDFSKISEEQILHTLKYINTWCFKNKLRSAEKKDIIEMIKKLASKGNLKYINQVRSLEGVGKALKIKIVDLNGKFIVEEHKKKIK